MANGKSLTIINPATGSTIAEVEVCSRKQLTEKTKHARAVQPLWEAVPIEERGFYLRRLQAWVTRNTDRLIETIVSETGKTFEDALAAEVAYISNALGFWAKHAEKYLADERIRTSSPFVWGRRLTVRYRPHGLVGVIGPWNYPLTNCFGDCVPALAAGNAVLLKPSHLTPMTSLLMRDALQECGFPDGFFDVVIGEGPIAQSLIDDVDMVMFTGSTVTGKKVMARAAETLTPVALELGGKDPMLVLHDANLDDAADAAVYGSMQNAGQTCISIERAYVHSDVYDEFVAKVVDRVTRLRQGVPHGPASVEIGAVTNPAQREVIEDHLSDARDKGAKVEIGGEASADGRFFKPTILSNADNSMECMIEETFGPTLPIMKVDSTRQAIELANRSQYGLAASVWTEDLERGERVARAIESGVVCVNDALVFYAALELPMGGWKSSGLGVRHGLPGIRKYCRSQSVLVARRRLPAIHTFPYSDRKSKILAAAVAKIYGRRTRK